jgi:AbiU2
MPLSIQMTDFEQELEVFRTEEEAAQQFFFAYLSVKNLAATDGNVLANMNNTPLFWRTTHHAMVLAAFVALARIFDQDPESDHNVDKLMRVTGSSLNLFTKPALAARRIAAGISQKDANRYAVGAYELTKLLVEVVRMARIEVAVERQ